MRGYLLVGQREDFGEATKVFMRGCRLHAHFEIPGAALKARDGV